MSAPPLANATRCHECAFVHAPPDQLEALLMACVGQDEPFLCHVANDAGLPAICRGYLNFFRVSYRDQPLTLIDVHALPPPINSPIYQPGLYLKITTREEATMPSQSFQFRYPQHVWTLDHEPLAQIHIDTFDLAGNMIGGAGIHYESPTRTTLTWIELRMDQRGQMTSTPRNVAGTAIVVGMAIQEVAP